MQALTEAGYVVLAHDVRAGRWQIDVIAEEGGDLVFVEVKTRRQLTFGTPAEAITPTKARHMILAAEFYLEEQGLLDRPWRIDVVAIALLPNQQPHIEIFRHAITA